MFYYWIKKEGFLCVQLVKNPPAIWETWVGRIPWRRERLPTPVFWSGEFHGLYSPWSCKELDRTERLSLSKKEDFGREEDCGINRGGRGFAKICCLV